MTVESAVNAILPGPTPTPGIDTLASDLSGFTTCAALPVDGGSNQI